MVTFISLVKLKLFTPRLILIDIFFLTEKKHCYYLEVEETVEEKVEEGRKLGSVADGGGCWVVMMDSDAEPRLHAHCGTLESLGRNPEEVMEAGRRLERATQCPPCPPPPQQSCLCAFSFFTVLPCSIQVKQHCTGL